MTEKTQDRSAYYADYDKKRNRIKVSYSSSEYKYMKTIAEALNLPLATVVHDLSLANSKQSVLISPAIEEELKTLSFLIRNMSKNLNQIAHHSNRVKQVIDENETLKIIRDLELTLKEAIKRQQE